MNLSKRLEDAYYSFRGKYSFLRNTQFNYLGALWVIKRDIERRRDQFTDEKLLDDKNLEFMKRYIEGVHEDLRRVDTLGDLGNASGAISGRAYRKGLDKVIGIKPTIVAKLVKKIGSIREAEASAIASFSSIPDFLF